MTLTADGDLQDAVIMLLGIIMLVAATGNSVNICAKMHAMPHLAYGTKMAVVAADAHSRCERKSFTAGALDD